MISKINSCKEAMGCYGCSYSIMLPYNTKFDWDDDSEYSPKYIAVDKCLLSEVLELWKLGIKTTGNCCGHGEVLSFISCKEGYEHKMLELGYENIINSYFPESRIYFKPKTEIILDVKQYAGF